VTKKPSAIQKPPYVEKAVALREPPVEEREAEPRDIGDERRVVAAQDEGRQRERREPERRGIGGGGNLHQGRPGTFVGENSHGEPPSCRPPGLPHEESALGYVEPDLIGLRT
jgi:hypothetical protein